MVGSTTGCRLFIDRLTEEVSQMTYARIFIKIDVECDYPEAIPVILDICTTYLLPVEYN